MVNLVGVHLVFWYHSKQHDSKTSELNNNHVRLFWYHSKQHDSKTGIATAIQELEFWYHSKQHDSKTSEGVLHLGS